MNVLVIDTDPTWIKFCKKLGFAINDSHTSKYDLAVVGTNSINILPLDIKTIVATNSPSTKESIQVLRINNVVDYISKDLQKDKILKKIG